MALKRDNTACAIESDKLEQLKKLGVDKLIFDLPAIDEVIYNEFMGTEGYQKFVLESISKSKKVGI